MTEIYNKRLSTTIIAALAVVAFLLAAVNVYAHGTGHHKVPKKKKQYPHNIEKVEQSVDHSGHEMKEKAMDHSGHDMSKHSDKAKEHNNTSSSHQDVVAVMNAWVREAVPESPVLGGYLTLVNGSQQAVTLERIESSQFDSIEIHKMGEVDGMMQMQRIDELTLDVGSSVVLKPGGKHLMMMGPERDLVTGDNVEVVFHFTNGARQVINLPVKK